MILKPCDKKNIYEDVYLLEKLGVNFLINLNYKDIQVFDENWKIIKTIAYGKKELSIYSVFKKMDNSKLFFDCSDENILSLVDLESRIVSLIKRTFNIEVHNLDSCQ